MAEAQLYESSPRHVSAFIRGSNERELRAHQRTWETARFVAFNSLMPHAKKGKLNKPTDLIRFAWEQAEVSVWHETPKMSKRESDRLDRWIAEKYPGAIELPVKKPRKNGRSKV